MGSKTVTNVTQNVLPEWYNQYAQNVLGKAYQATSEPYQAYGAPRIAGFAPEQEQAFGMAKQNVGSYQPYIDVATQQIGAGTGSFTTPGTAQQYMSPYLSSVVSGIGSTAARNLYENIIPQINRTFVGGGTFGGSRNAEFMNRAVRDTQSAALSEQMKQMQTGYEQAQGQYNTEAGRALTAAPLLASLGQQQQQQAGVDINAIQGIGQARQGLAQTSADLAYQDFLRQQNYPLEQAQNLAGIGSQISVPGGSTIQTSQQPKPSSTAQTIGTIAGIAGTAAKLFGAKDGGEINQKRAKRPVKKTKRPVKQGLGWLKEAA